MSETGATERASLHFVRFRDDRYLTAVKVFGRPDFIHRHWDHRAVAEAGRAYAAGACGSR